MRRDEQAATLPRNRIMCPDCQKPKILFETERKANDFIRWNGDNLENQCGKLRAYYCPACCGWHISHQKYRKSYDSRTDNLISAFDRQKKKRTKIDRLIHKIDYEAKAREIYEDMPQIATKNGVKKYLTEFFSENNIRDDGGWLRKEVYKLWEQNRIEI